LKFEEIYSVRKPTYEFWGILIGLAGTLGAQDVHIRKEKKKGTRSKHV
jgi:hypothetical protein